MTYLPGDHTFAVCAYGENQFLSECIESLLAQTKKSKIIICTSTPNEHISAVSAKYKLPLFINSTSGGIASDWNYAYEVADTPLVTLAHQDDIYDPEYAQQMVEHVNEATDVLICFSDYYEIRGGLRVYADSFINLRIKQILLAPLKKRSFQTRKWLRKRILSFGNPIGCPSVTYVKPNLVSPIFMSDMKSNIDWYAWTNIAQRDGSFVYVHEALMGHRIYERSTTMQMINDNNSRREEDLRMLREFWPEPVAKLICKFYAQSQRGRTV